MKRFENRKSQLVFFVLSITLILSCQTQDEPAPVKTFNEVAQVGGAFEPALLSKK